MVQRDDHHHQQLVEAVSPSRPRAGAWIPPSPEALGGVFPKVQVLALIGQGGMGAVYKARQTHLDRVVALKLLAPELSAQADFAQRFQREAMVLARLAHPHIVALYDVGEAGGWKYLVMEYVEGATLREVLSTGPFTAGAALTLAPQLCAALAYAHERGVVHRDLKPENILIDASGTGHIADFGLASLRADDLATPITKTGQVLGTAAYMAPEQLAGSATIDHRADLYALGVIIYEMLTGHLPLGRFEPPSQQGRLDVRIDAVVLQALERTPELRWQSAEEMRRAVDALTPGAPPTRTTAAGRRWLGAAGVLGGVLGCLLTVLAVRTPALRRIVSDGFAHPGMAATSSMPTPAAQRATPSTPTTPMTPARLQDDDQLAMSAPPQAGGTTHVQVVTTDVVPPPAPAVPAIPPATEASQAPSVTPQPVTAPPHAKSGTTEAHPVATPTPPAGVGAVAVSAVDQPSILSRLAESMWQRLVIRGPGAFILEGDPALHSYRDLRPQLTPGIEISLSAENEVVFTLLRSHLILHVPPAMLRSLRYEGSGRLQLAHLAGDRLNIEHSGPGTIDMISCDARQVELIQTSRQLTRLAGHLQSLVVQIPPLAVVGADAWPTVGLVGPETTALIDARGIAAESITANAMGPGLLQLAGHVRELTLRVDEGEVDAGGLTADHADITLTGRGHVSVGDLGALEATCTGSGTLRWTGHPVIGRMITTQRP